MKREASKITEKYVSEKTFESSMLSIAQNFMRIEESLGMIVKELKNLHEDNKYMRQTLSSFTSDVSRHDRKISNLDVRVEKLELKSK